MAGIEALITTYMFDTNANKDFCKGHPNQLLVNVLDAIENKNKITKKNADQ